MLFKSFSRNDLEFDRAYKLCPAFFVLLHNTHVYCTYCDGKREKPAKGRQLQVHCSYLQESVWFVCMCVCVNIHVCACVCVCVCVYVVNVFGHGLLRLSLRSLTRSLSHTHTHTYTHACVCACVCVCVCVCS